MRNIDLRNLSIEDLQDKLDSEKTSYQTLKVSHKITSIENPIQLRGMRRNIARISTIITEKQNSSK